MRPVRSLFAGGLVILALASCSEDSLPTAPDGPPPPSPPVASNSAFVGNIMDADTHRVCIENARAEIIAGPLSGRVYPQNRDNCEDPGGGFVINDLPVDSVIRLRASAPGYVSVEREFVIVRAWASIDINLKRAG